jgi:hypothetical protein
MAWQGRSEVLFEMLILMWLLQPKHPFVFESSERKPIIGSYMPVVASFGLMCSDFIIN